MRIQRRHAQAGDYAKAEQALHKAVSISPDLMGEEAQLVQASSRRQATASNLAADASMRQPMARKRLRPMQATAD